MGGVRGWNPRLCARIGWILGFMRGWDPRLHARMGSASSCADGIRGFIRGWDPRFLLDLRPHLRRALPGLRVGCLIFRPAAAGGPTASRRCIRPAAAEGPAASLPTARSRAVHVHARPSNGPIAAAPRGCAGGKSLAPGGRTPALGGPTQRPSRPAGGLAPSHSAHRYSRAGSSQHLPCWVGWGSGGGPLRPQPQRRLPLRARMAGGAHGAPVPSPCVCAPSGAP